MIPKIIYTCWFSPDGKIPPKIREYINTQKINGYAHVFLTLDNCFNDHPYIQQCLSSPHGNKKWVKLTDFLRMWYLYHSGGFFIDSDVSILEDRNFDSLLDSKMVVGLEGAGTIPNSVVIGSAIVGAEPGNPVIKEWLSTVISNFRGDTSDCYESSMEILNKLAIQYQDKITIVQPDVFYPYHHQSGVTKITDNTICVHHFWKSWIDKPVEQTTEHNLPTVSIIIPQLGREQGLKLCLKSISELNYPKHLIDIHVIEGEETVPIKVHKGVKQSSGEFIAYAANDMTFDKDCILNAILASKRLDKALVSFNEGHLLPDCGNICTHFILRRDFLPEIGGYCFMPTYHHRGCDNELWRQCELKGQAHWEESAKIDHRHFSKGYEYDWVYQRGWEVNETLKTEEGLDYVY